MKVYTQKGKQQVNKGKSIFKILNAFCQIAPRKDETISVSDYSA